MIDYPDKFNLRQAAWAAQGDSTKHEQTIDAIERAAEKGTEHA